MDNNHNDLAESLQSGIPHDHPSSHLPQAPPSSTPGERGLATGPAATCVVGGPPLHSSSDPQRETLVDKTESREVPNYAATKLTTNASLSLSVSGKSFRRGLEKLLPRIKPPAIELQIETTSRIGARLIFATWYVTLLLALILQGLISLQWQCKSICNERSCSLNDVTSFNSRACVNATNLSIPGEDPVDGPAVSSVVWQGGFTYVYDTALNRFVNLIFTMPRPNSTASRSDTLYFTLKFSLALFNMTSGNGDGPSSHDRDDDLEYPTTVRCPGGANFCETVLLPAATSSVSNRTHFLLSIFNVTQSVAQAASNASIGAVYQKKSYTIATITLRYIMFVLSSLHFIRFLYRKKFLTQLYEQTWIIFLHLGLILYLNPLFAAGVYINPEPQFLSFLEFRPPTYFMALLIAFMFTLITSSMSWGEGAQQGGSTHPPLGTKLTSFAFLAIIFAIDMVDAWVYDWDWSKEHCPNFKCNPAGYTLYATMAFGVLMCTLWLYWMRNNLGKKPYLSSRPQQLAMRLFMFMFSTLVIYFVLQGLLVLWWYRAVSTLVTFQTLLQVGPLLVSYVFVQLITYAYTTTVRNERVPMHPTDVRWKRRVWPTAWFQWLSRHGGSMYMFFSEGEQDRFNQIQEQYHTSPQLFEHQAEGFDVVSSDDEHAGAEAGDGTAGGDDEDEDAIPSCDFDSSRTTLMPENQRMENGERGRSRTMARIMDAQRRVQKTAGRVQQSVETLLVDRPAELFDRIEDRIINMADYLAGLAKRRKPFFNLETAVDCFNHSWEAYGVSQSQGDSAVDTGYQIEIGVKSVLRNIPVLNKCCTCCFAGDDDEDFASPTLRQSPTGASFCNNSEVSLSSSVRSSPRNSSSNNNFHKNDSCASGAQTPASPTKTRVAPKVGPSIDVEQYGHVLMAVFEALDVQVIVTERAADVTRHRGKHNRLVVAFRGTDNANNAKQDAMIKRVTWNEMEATLWETTTYNKPSVHVGFLTVWNALREQVMGIVSDVITVKGGDHEVVVTGHSLGGALAVLASYTIAKYLRHIHHAREDVKCYTFGMPRVGNTSFRHAFERMVPNMFRLVNESDAVSNLSIMGGSHVGMEVDIDRHGNFIIEPMFIEKVFRPTKGKGSSIVHHSMKAYADSLNAVAECGLGWCPSRCLLQYTTGEEKRQLKQRSDQFCPPTPSSQE